MQQNLESILARVFGKVLHQLFLTTRGLTLGVRAVIRSDDGRFLLVRHTYTAGWHFPGGGVEKGETVEEALCKELRQETGLALVATPRLHAIFLNADVSQRDHVLLYLCVAKGDIKQRPKSMEIAEVGYFDAHDLPNGTEAGTIRRIQEIIEKTPPPALW